MLRVLLPVVLSVVGYADAEPDLFDEVLHLQILPSNGPEQLALARFHFLIQRPSAAVGSDHFDLFPKQLGKLLNAHQALVAFEAALTRGRWKEEWGQPPRDFRPPGAIVVAGTQASSQKQADDSWSFLLSALSGALCASFEGMDPGRASAGSRPLRVPWKRGGQDMRLATLPYEPICTENLTPWLKLLPCGKHMGLAALIAPLTTAESPFVSLVLEVKAEARAEGRGGMAGGPEMHASLDVVLPLPPSPHGGGAGEDFGQGLGQRLSNWLREGFKACPAARASTVLLSSPDSSPGKDAVRAAAQLLQLPDPEGRTLRVPTGILELGNHGSGSGSGPAPAKIEGLPAEEKAGEAAEGVSVMRDVLSREGRSERTHGRYLLRFTNSGPGRRVHFMDQLPGFLKPLWHSLRATFTQPGAPLQELAGLPALSRLRLRFVPSDAEAAGPTELFLTVEVPRGGVVSVFLDVSKAFIQLSGFSYACEKGFDVGSAAWLEAEVGAEGEAEADQARRGGALSHDSYESHGPEASTRRLHLSGGLLVLLPMPDFSMPFNVIALSSTAVTFFFGSLFRLTAAGRMPHWLLKKEEGSSSSTGMSRGRLLLLAAALGLYVLSLADLAQLAELRRALPAPASPLVDLIESLKETMDKISR